MLTYLRIRDLALVEDASIEPGVGLVAFTGETGAGKSIILGGLDLVIGRRAALDQVRAGASEAVVEALFDISGRQDVVALLASEGIEVGEPELLVRRRIAARGSRAYVNDNLVTVAMLDRLGALLVDIVGQHESQTLLAPSSQLELLDAAGELIESRREVESLWDQAALLHREFAALRADDRDRAQRADYLRFQLEEIRAAQLDPAEEAELAADRQRLRHADELSNAAVEALGTLYESEDAASVLVARAEEAVATIVALDAGADLPVAGLQEARWGIEEMGRSLQLYRDSVQADPQRLEAVETRLAEIDTLRRKYGDTVADVLARAEQAEKELATIENRDEELTRRAEGARAAVRDYDHAARRLGAARREAAEQLQGRITEELQVLGMEGARFVARLAAEGRDTGSGLPPGATRSGYEGVEFQLAANPGEPERPLSRVASGGEMSRVLLALKLAAMASAPSQTLVFDEIDAGIGGGRVAERLADRLGHLGASHQVLVVTHLPQIAARADTQVRVSKAATDERTTVQTVALDPSGRVDELARMLGGIEATEGLREHARELLQRDE